MQNEHEAKHILKNKKKLLQNVSLKNVSIIDDKTPNQIECLKELRMELEQRKSNGEENLTIKYIQGFHNWLCFYTNLATLNSKFNELLCNIQNLNPQIILITETWLTSNDLDSLYNIDNYSLYRCDRRNRRGGGTCIYLSSEITNNFSVTSLDITVPNIELLGLKICHKNSFVIHLVCVYRPGDSRLADDDSLIASLDELSSLENLIVIGDFNFRDISWPITDPPSDLSTSKNVFTDFVLNSNLHQFITEPTRFRINNLPSILDLVFSNDPHVLTHPLISSPVGNSDHAVITFHIQFNLQYCTPNVNKTVYEIIDFENANRQLADIDWNDVFGDIRDPVVFWDKFLHVVNFCKNQNTVKKTIYKNNIKPWINGELIYLIKYKRKLWNKYRRTNRIEDLLIHRNFARDLKKSLHEARVAYEESIAISSNCKKLYKYIRSSLTTKVSIPLLEKDNGDISQSNYENAEVLARPTLQNPICPHNDRVTAHLAYFAPLPLSLPMLHDSFSNKLSQNIT
ncbi:uncharacterized protein LOC126890122 [Diabrotica virgifera virgifera]|uniref:Endonuclease/exonuclease/phosphatase domain-containing protein n=1 Tax=Diabrotica virgifera virgifera TaxID=50390 RepID=A0ABM5KXK4_DIAVI|nr:uncharacterized protein LOC126890122 [Diabrotica virgifera virgifera]